MFSLLKVPTLSAPLTKAIRTSEGVMMWALNLGIAALASIEPQRLPAKEAAILVSANTALHTAQRFGLKGIALLKSSGTVTGDPIPFDPLPSGAAGEIDHILADGAELAGTLAARPASAVTPDGAQPLAPIAPAGTRTPDEQARIAAGEPTQPPEADPAAGEQGAPFDAGA